MGKLFIILMLYFIFGIITYILITYQNIQDYKKDEKVYKKGCVTIREYLDEQSFGNAILCIIWPVYLLSYVIYLVLKLINKLIIMPILNKLINKFVK